MSKLSDACNICTGKLDANHGCENGKYPFFTCAPEPLRIDRYAFDCDAILLAGNNAQGNFHIQRFTGKFNAYQRTYVLTAKDGFDIDYVKYSIEIALSHFKRLAQGSQTKFLTIGMIEDFYIGEKDYSEQKRTVQVLKAIDDKIALNQKINDNLQQQLRLLYDYWFTQFDFPNENSKPYHSSGGQMVWNEDAKKDIPVGWNCAKMSDAVEGIRTGLNPRDNFKLGNGTIKYITVKNLRSDGILDFSGCDTIDETARAIVHRRSDVCTGDILFASIAPLGRCHLVQESPQDWDINESVFSIRCNKATVTPEYLYMHLQSEAFVKESTACSTGSVFKGIRINTLLDSRMLLPPMQVVEKFSQQTKHLFSLQYKLNKEIQALTQLRDWLLPMLMNGQATISD